MFNHLKGRISGVSSIGTGIVTVGSSTSNLKKMNSCLLCYKDYSDDFLRNKRIDVLDITNTTNAFTIFCKILDMDASPSSSSWDFTSEAMPFCASCTSLAFRLSSLYDELAMIQQEIILNSEMIKETLYKSQKQSFHKKSSDHRVNIFRKQIFRLLNSRSKNSSNIYNQHMDPNQDEFNSDPVDEIKATEISMPSIKSHSKEYLEEYESNVPKDFSKKALFLGNDMEVFEIEDKNQLENEHKKRSVTPSSDEEMNSSKSLIVESQLRIQRSYNEHFSRIKNSKISSVTVPIESTFNSTYPSPPMEQQTLHSPIPSDILDMKVVALSQLSPYSTDSNRLTPPTSPSTGSTTGIHTCHFCSKTYNKPYQLKAHLRLHTGEKPYKCNVCNKTFRLAGNLRVHTRIHTGETPYECSHCGKRCTQKSQLNTHVLIHHKKMEQQIKQGKF